MTTYPARNIPQQTNLPARSNGRHSVIPLNDNIERSSAAAGRIYPRKIALPTIEGIHFEKVDEIISLEAKGNYTALKFINKRELLVSKTLREIEKLLKDGARFVRVHRSFTINLDFILKYIKGKGGYVVMEDKSNVMVSVGKKQALMEALEAYYC